MERNQFLRRVALSREAPVQALGELSLPLSILLLGTTVQVIRQFQTLIRRKAVYRAFEFRNTHTLDYTVGIYGFKT